MRNHHTKQTAYADIENEGIYAAIIVENRNKKLKDITEDFDMTAEALSK